MTTVYHRLYGKLLLCFTVILISISISFSQSHPLMDAVCPPISIDNSEALIYILQKGRHKYYNTGPISSHMWSKGRIPFVAGKDHPVVLSPKYPSGKEKGVYWKIWIDFNRDGDFNDLYEYVAYGNGVGAIEGNIKLPKDILNGEALMRIAISTQAFPRAACDIVEVGEVVDYVITISEGLDESEIIPEKGGLFVYMPNVIGENNSVDEVEEEVVEIAASTRLVEEELHVTYSLNVAPNPSTTSSKIVMYADGKPQAIRGIEVFDRSGKLYLRRDYMTNSRNEMMLQTHNWPAGMYSIRAINHKGEMAQTRLVVVR